MRFVPRSVMIGFVYALAIVIFLAQMPQLRGGALATRWSPAGLAIIYMLPRFTTRRAVAAGRDRRVDRRHGRGGIAVPTVGDMGALPAALPVFGCRPSRSRSRRWRSSLPYALALAAVGLIESLLTAQIVDEMTDTPSDKEPRGAGPGHRERRHRLLRRHGRLRDDRPDDDEREGLRRPDTDLDLLRRRVPARARRRPRQSSSCSWPLPASKRARTWIDELARVRATARPPRG